MERTKQKSKKDQPNKYVDKEKPQSFIMDVKTLRENLKIKEILRTVKMNSSMRVKAPRGSKVMHSKDFNDNEDFIEDIGSGDGQNGDPPSATNDVVVAGSRADSDALDSDTGETTSQHTDSTIDVGDCEGEVEPDLNTCVIHKSKSLSEGLEVSGQTDPTTIETTVDDSVPTPADIGSSPLKTRDRKLSLDQTMFSSRKGLSQSELDLHTIGKSPLERKSSFFRKKMDSFLKNTTEMFKRQSMSSKCSQSTSRRDSTGSRMSVSLQSLNEDAPCSGEYGEEALDTYHEGLQGSMSSLRSSVTAARSGSSLSALADRPDADSLAGSRARLGHSQTLIDGSSPSIQSLNEGYVPESFLNSRAISMSSGLDTAHGKRNRKTSRANRVTWVASESLTDYFRRLIQDEKSKELQVCHSYQDFGCIPEHAGARLDSRGRRLSYQRAVSGEDPSRYHDSSRRRKIAENLEGGNDLTNCLADFTKNGVPPLVGFTIKTIPDDALAYLLWAESESNLEEHYNWKQLPPMEEARQAVIKELLHTEADHIRHLMTIVEVYIAAAHALQDVDRLLDLDTSRLYLNIPDVLNANMMFWELVMYPMVADSFKNGTTFNPELMAPGFARFSEIFESYEDYVCHQSKAVDYLRAMTSNAEFMTYLTWCHNQNPANRLQLGDILVKPMQRLTKYSLIIRRIITYTEPKEGKAVLVAMEATAVTFVHRVNRAIRQREEVEKLTELEKILESYDVDFKDEDLDRYFHLLNDINLKAPMVNCGPDISRTIIYQGDLRYKDSMKEVEARVILLTDMLLICKKLSKGSPYVYKMIRPKFLMERSVPFVRFSNRSNPHEVTGLVYVMVDEHGTAYTAFCLSEPAKDPNPQQTLRIWDQKIREARLTYELSVWFYKNPVRDLSEVELDSMAEFEKVFVCDLQKLTPDEYTIERRARERVAAMMHPNRRASTGQEITTMRSDSLDRARGPPSLRHPLHRTSTGGSSRNSRLSSFHQSTSSRNSRLSSFHHSTSAASHDELPSAMKYLYQTGSSVEHLIPPQNPDDVATSITVNVVSESECETVVPSRQPTPPLVLLEQPSPAHAGGRSVSAGSSQHTLRVSPHHSLALVHSLPDLTIEQNIQMHKPTTPTIQQSASEKLYQSHQELLQRNRRAASGPRLLAPGQRGVSYPPPSPTRASLKRGLAFSYSFKNPPLSKMGHVNSQSTQVHDQAQAAHAAHTAHAVKEPTPGTSTDKGEKKKSLIGRSKASAKSHSPEPAKDRDSKSEAGEEFDRLEEADDNRSRKSDKSTKSNKSGKYTAKVKSDKMKHDRQERGGKGE